MSLLHSWLWWLSYTINDQKSSGTFQLPKYMSPNPPWPTGRPSFQERFSVSVRTSPGGNSSASFRLAGALPLPPDLTFGGIWNAQLRTYNHIQWKYSQRLTSFDLWFWFIFCLSLFQSVRSSFLFYPTLSSCCCIFSLYIYIYIFVLKCCTNCTKYSVAAEKSRTIVVPNGSTQHLNL